MTGKKNVYEMLKNLYKNTHKDMVKKERIKFKKMYLAMIKMRCKVQAEIYKIIFDIFIFPPFQINLAISVLCFPSYKSKQ